MSDHDTALREAWHRFCDELKAAGDIAFRSSAPRGAVDRAAGVRLLSRNIALALAFELENRDPAAPGAAALLRSPAQAGRRQHRRALCRRADQRHRHLPRVGSAGHGSLLRRDRRRARHDAVGWRRGGHALRRPDPHRAGRKLRAVPQSRGAARQLDPHDARDVSASRSGSSSPTGRTSSRWRRGSTG